MIPIESDLVVWRVLAAILITVNGVATFYGLKNAKDSERSAIECTSFSCAIMVCLMTPYLVPYLFGAHHAVAIASVYVPIAHAVAFILIVVYLWRVFSQRPHNEAESTRNRGS